MGRKRKRLRDVESETVSEDIDSNYPDGISRKLYSYSSAAASMEYRERSESKTDISSWNCDNLLELKHRLCFIKSQLNHVEISQWHEHTCRTNCANEVIKLIRRTCYPEMCTQAWCKFYEVLSTFDLVPNDYTKFASVHLCEAPGAFISSLNHFIQINSEFLCYL